MVASRLFDFLTENLKSRPIGDTLAGKENGQWRKYSTAEVFETVCELSCGLLRKGMSLQDGSVEGRDKIALISKNCPEWIMLDHAVQRIGAVLTPIYPTISTNELQFILSDAKVKIVFVHDAELYDKVLSIKDQLSDLLEVYTFLKLEHAPFWKDLLIKDEQLNEEVNLISDKIRSEDIATIIYTSGTTGKPKGVMLSHKNILSNVIDSTPAFPKGENFRALSFLPLNHIFEKMITYLYLYNGTAIYYAESMDKIADNLREINPDLFSTVPRLLEKVYERIMVKGSELKGIKKGLFFWAHKLASRYEINKDLGFIYNMQLAIANKLIFNKWREALGNRIVCIVSGGAACQPRLIKIFTAAKIPILEGYGLTETSPVISVNRMNVTDRYFGTVGPLIDNVSVRIAEDGEILCKGPNIMMGYYKNPELTAENVVDGWFKTGDIGEMVEGRFLKITDRKKEIFKTSGGKYVAPMVIENKLKESRFIENIMVTGAGKKFVSALIVPSLSNLNIYCNEHNIPVQDPINLVKNKKVIEYYQSIVTHYNESFNHVEQIKKFQLLPKEWSVEGGELTPKLSLKRKVIEQKYAQELLEIYDQS